MSLDQSLGAGDGVALLSWDFSVINPMTYIDWW